MTISHPDGDLMLVSLALILACGLCYLVGVVGGQRKDDRDTRRMLADMLWQLEGDRVVTHQNYTVRRVDDYFVTDTIASYTFDRDDEGMCDLLDFLLRGSPHRTVFIDHRADGGDETGDGSKDRPYQTFAGMLKKKRK